VQTLVHHGPGATAWEEVADPTALAADTDAIIKVDVTTICGTDLHILKGDVPAMIDGRTIGHEAFGADVVVNNMHDDPRPVMEELTVGFGADVAIEAVGLSATFTLATTRAPRQSCGQRRSVVSEGTMR
jgi:threonine dehydrogenase-like Zn-dependent dehydrogenase